MTLKEIAKRSGRFHLHCLPCFKPAKHQSGQRSGTGAHLEHCSKNRVCPQSSRTRAPACFTAHPGYAVYLRINCLFPREVRDDPFFPRIISSIEQEAFQSNFVLKYTYSMLEFQTPAAARQSGGCDSDNLIIVGRFQPSLLTSMKKRFRNIVYVGLNNLEAECDQVLCDCFFCRSGYRTLFL